jgi:hypothetical protein
LNIACERLSNKIVASESHHEDIAWEATEADGNFCAKTWLKDKEDFGCFTVSQASGSKYCAYPNPETLV